MANLIVGTDAANVLDGSSDRDVIYGYDPGATQGEPVTIVATRVASGLNQPLYATAAPGDASRLFIVEKGGLVRILDLNTQQVSSTPFLDVSTQVTTAGECGLLGLAFDPDFATNGFVYVNLINLAGDTEIRRYQVSADDPNQIDPASAQLVIAIAQPDFTNHKAGWLGFGPDGFLYAALGDGGNANDPFDNAQNIDSLLGKILRLDVHDDAFPEDDTRNYAVPADNPFVGTDGADEIWALGLRNPWRDGFDRALGDLFIADVGQGAREEIDLGSLGANYGWDLREGDIAGPGTGTPGTLPLVDPIHSYDIGSSQSVTGGYVYRGPSDTLQGQYFFADFIHSRIFTLSFNGTTWVATDRTAQIFPDAGTIGSPASFGEDALGNLYVVDIGGEVFRLTPLAPSADQGDTLSGLAGDDMLYGGAGGDLLTGGADDDSLFGGDGADTLRAAGGDDILLGGEGADSMLGGVGEDQLFAAGGNDTLLGGAGNDSLHGQGGDDSVDGGDGDDTLTAALGNDIVLGGNGNDSVVSGVGNDTLAGGEGADRLDGRNGNDALHGQGGDDSVDGGDGNDTLTAAGGNDVLTGGNGDDSLRGGLGDDVFQLTATALGAGDVAAGDADIIGIGAGDLLEITAELAALLTIGDGDTIGGIDGSSNIWFDDDTDQLMIDLNDDGGFVAGEDFSIELVGVATVTWHAAGSSFSFTLDP